MKTGRRRRVNSIVDESEEAAGFSTSTSMKRLPRSGSVTILHGPGAEVTEKSRTSWKRSSSGMAIHHLMDFAVAGMSERVTV